MSDARAVIAAALFNYSQGADQAIRGKRPWGIEGAEWRADAVIDALTKAGFYIARPMQEVGAAVFAAEMSRPRDTAMKPRDEAEGVARDETSEKLS